MFLNKRIYKFSVGFICVAGLLFVAPTGIQAKKDKKKDLLTNVLKKDSLSDFNRMVKDAKVQKGLFNVWFNEKTGKLYFEIPDSALTKTYILASRVASTSDATDYVAGQMNVTPLLVNFTTDGRNLYMHKIQDQREVSPNDPIAPAFQRNNMDPVLKGFKIQARHGKSLLIDVSTFFSGNEKCISPIKDDSPIAKLLGGGGSLKGIFQSDASGISSVKAFARNIEIESLLSYQTTGVVQKPYSVTMHRSFFVLPDNPMPMRLQDNRVGYFYNEKDIFSSNADRIDSKTFIDRWRLEPSDRARYFNGELVKPKQQIVFYVDSAFPEKWRQTIKDGILEWNHAFEKAGFKDAIVVKDYPKNDPDFDPDDMRYSCFRYVATPTANAMGPSYKDPRTGEILSADVIWYHNIVSLLHNWRFVQTGAVDPRVRKAKFDDDVMRESIKYAASHEVGHCLGLMHNMGASYAFPVEKLRDPAFTQQYGTTPSIMDYARNNYVAQPGDMEKGVKLTPPALGVYDVYAINWGYRLIPGAKTPDDEKPTLDQWINEKAGDPMYEFGAQQMFSTIDPTDLTEDLGNDHIKASNYGISNLKILMNHLEDWTMEKGERYDQTEKVYREVARQYGRYVGHVMPYIGGIRYEEIRQGDGKTTSRHYIDKATQQKALYWLLAQARSYDSWLTPRKLISKLEIDMNANAKLRSQIVSSLMSAPALYRIEQGGEENPTVNYKLSDYLTDLEGALFKAPKGGTLSDAEQALEGAAIDQMINNAGLKPAAKTTSLTSDAIYAAFCQENATPSLPCDYAASDDFVRINLGPSALTKDQMGAIMTGCLRRTLRKFNTYKAQATGLTRDFYAFQAMKIEKALSDK